MSIPKRQHLSLPKMLTLGFLIIILIGTILLSLPIATRGTHTTSVLDALFTATSATCVTGLTLVSTALHWSIFGQTVILLLMELGGLGFMTFTVMLFLFMRRQMKLSTRLLAQESLNLDNLSQLSVIKLILFLSLIIQFAGAGLLMVDFYPRYGLIKGLWFSIFHAVSAFCNAGFDLFGNSLEGFANDPYVLSVMAILIIAGSFGFLVWQDLLLYPRRHHLTLHTKLALGTGSVLMLLSIVVYLLSENNLAFLGPHVSYGNRLINTVFMAITPRTAGLITLPYQQLSIASIAFTMLLMFIGGTPGSTAGGVKTTTIGLLTLQSIATLRGKRDATFGHRRFTQANVFRALTLIFVALIILATATLILCATQPIPNNDGLQTVTFEVLAAFGTTGISLGLTPHLNLLGKLIIMFLMFIGRVGIYTVMFSILNANRKQLTYRYPEESVPIG
ncbi:Trk family potassium uptake protein [Lactobacillus sp. LC28-10]|uniref:Trk family potassium uptake protein n=1 Tax=Secundilactobacillus angelensis TaxID=2722706 RepID=A0ABX1KVZ2_9LACO|nr:potassium transporter TrkG [Secundilactobacillus angelensis]MCH5462416.1 Trk family potassium uptake protein [Secundilactobacillus angelensis]NLR18102.1 Trk family potassium uptake protein [Secundilactobacillus angelensis]